MINSVCGIRSTGRICTDIAQELENNGHECKIAYGREAVPTRFEKYAVRIGSDFGVNLHAGLSRIFDKSGFYSRRATAKFIKWIKTYDPDIIHLHNLHGYYLNIKVLFDYLKQANKPMVWTLHDCWTFTGHCPYFDMSGCEKWKTGCEHCPQKKQYPVSLVFDNSKKNYLRKKACFTDVDNLTIVSPSQWLKDLVGNSFLREYPVNVIANGVDIEVFKPTNGDFKSRYGLDGKTVILGVAGVWEERKGLNDFIRLAKILDDKYRIVLVGLSDAQLAELPENVIGIKRTNNVSELAEIYTAADVLFNPTYEDNYPTVNLEAQACGTPVITYATGGSGESVPTENVVPRGDLQSVIKLLESNLTVKDVKNTKDFCDEYLSLYNSVVQ
ncbi:MAG: glycosyltransferase [Clostridiales bacterium]|nr:glycosyltransferase [Clostridiales bacterium]